MTGRREECWSWQQFARWYGPIQYAEGQYGTPATSDNAVAFADLLDVSARTIVRWRTAGIPETQADRIACQVGVHPSTIWPAWFARIEDVA